MVIVDSRIGSHELIPYIRKCGVVCEETNLEYGDAYFEGNGPNSRINIGFERKTLHDMLHSIDDNRYAAHQMPGMAQMYDKSFLIIEGLWKPHEDGTLMEGFKGGSIWGQCKHGTNRVMYAKLRRYLYSIQLAGVVVIYTRDIFQTAYDICEAYHYFSKSWSGHTSLLELQKLAMPSLIGEKASICRQWASALTDVGTKFSLEAEKLFKSSPIKLATSNEVDWLRIPRIGVKLARNIIREINER